MDRGEARPAAGGGGGGTRRDPDPPETPLSVLPGLGLVATSHGLWRLRDFAGRKEEALVSNSRGKRWTAVATWNSNSDLSEKKLEPTLFFAACSEDGKVRLWTLHDPRSLLHLHSTEGIQVQSEEDCFVPLPQTLAEDLCDISHAAFDSSADFLALSMPAETWVLRLSKRGEDSGRVSVTGVSHHASLETGGGGGGLAGMHFIPGNQSGEKESAAASDLLLTVSRSPPSVRVWDLGPQSSSVRCAYDSCADGLASAMFGHSLGHHPISSTAMQRSRAGDDDGGNLRALMALGNPGGDVYLAELSMPLSAKRSGSGSDSDITIRKIGSLNVGRGLQRRAEEEEEEGSADDKGVPPTATATTAALIRKNKTGAGAGGRKRNVGSNERGPSWAVEASCEILSMTFLAECGGGEKPENGPEEEEEEEKHGGCDNWRAGDGALLFSDGDGDVSHHDRRTGRDPPRRLSRRGPYQQAGGGGAGLRVLEIERKEWGMAWRLVGGGKKEVAKRGGGRKGGNREEANKRGRGEKEAWMQEKAPPPPPPPPPRSASIYLAGVIRYKKRVEAKGEVVGGPHTEMGGI